MSYKKWFIRHSQKHKKIVNSLLKRGFGKKAIIEYFYYENLKLKEPKFCPLFVKDKKCHDMKNLNCYLCGCDNFRFNDRGFKKIDDNLLVSYCKLNLGDKIISKGKIHHNCSNCQVPHKKRYISKKFNFYWGEVMGRV